MCPKTELEAELIMALAEAAIKIRKLEKIIEAQESLRKKEIPVRGEGVDNEVDFI
jgi:hypothetical protein